jgi:hypothetical protein
MVRFGNYGLPNVQQAQLQTTRVEIERSIAGRNIAYRADQTTKGRTVKVTGQIRAGEINTARFWIELLRRLADDTERLLDLEDSQTSPFNAKLLDPSYALDVSGWIDGDYQVPYSVTLLEVS